MILRVLVAPKVAEKSFMVQLLKAL
jgi:hypothetical protein